MIVRSYPSSCFTSNNLSQHFRIELGLRISENITAADGVFSKFSRDSDGSSSVMAMDASVVRHISRDVKDRVGAININDK